MPNNRNDDIVNDPMEEIIGGNQPSMTDYFPEANELTVEDFQKEFHRNGKRYVTNLENGLLLEYDAIMGFFCRATEQG